MTKWSMTNSISLIGTKHSYYSNSYFLLSLPMLFIYTSFLASPNKMNTSI